MQDPYAGQCECGAVRFRCNAQPLGMYNCHCKGCQAIAGSACMHLVVMRSDMVEIDGQLQQMHPPVAQDQHGQRWCCALCSKVLFASSTMPDILLIDAAWLAETGSFKAVAEIWTIDANPADAMDTHIPKVWKSPPLIGQEFV
jgi:hypothetical protein